ncbi:MAG TPA: imidazole glycerol phosphate synthase subunit HisH [bacterium]|nr:imidazole glycerol phosphate synthase subunit HisH [bacterium]
MIAIIDYGSGNIASLTNALGRLGVASTVTADPKVIVRAQGVIFPGQGRAGSAMQALRATGLNELIPTLTQPFLGICLGMQLLTWFTEEDETKGLGIIEAACYRFPSTLTVPQVGWNSIRIVRECPILIDIAEGSYFYFVHSYYAYDRSSSLVATTSYGLDYASIVQKDNFFGVQFHPEKSGESGMQLLHNFVSLCS